VWGDDDEGPNMGNAGLASVEDAFHGGGTTRRSRHALTCSWSSHSLLPHFFLCCLPLVDDGGLTFEELCRARIQEFAKGAEKYANETQLLQRVRKWQEKLRPLLEDEERRQVFDIHEYGRAIIDSIQNELATRDDNKNNDINDDESADMASSTVPFEVVSRDRPTYDVPRLFLAALSLCNAGNVRIDEELNLQLLSPVMEHPMETFLAPLHVRSIFFFACCMGVNEREDHVDQSIDRRSCDWYTIHLIPRVATLALAFSGTPSGRRWSRARWTAE
jgi:Condensin II complex subunit CAP-H2 or CNDH2, C-term